MTLLRYTTPETNAITYAKIVQLGYHPEEQTLSVEVALMDDSGPTPVERKRLSVPINRNIPATVLTQLDGLVTRIYTYLQNQGIVPAGTEE